MSKINASSVFGNYKWTAEFDLTAPQLEALAPFGVLNILQRVPSSNAEKTMAGYEKRPKGFKRTDIPFKPEHAKVLESAVSKLVIPDNEGEAKFTVGASAVTVEEYFGSTTEIKYAQARAKYGEKQGDREKLAKLAKTVGYTGELGDGVAANAPEEFLAAIHGWVKAQADKL